MCAAIIQRGSSIDPDALDEAVTATSGYLDDFFEIVRQLHDAAAA